MKIPKSCYSCSHTTKRDAECEKDRNNNNHNKNNNSNEICSKTADIVV